MQSPLSDYYIPYLADEKYVFTTDDGRIYSVTLEEQAFFSSDEFAFADQTYELFLTLEKAPPVYSTDPKIGATVAAIIRNFIAKDASRLVCFTCDTADGRHFVRYKRFLTWFMENNDGHTFKLEDSVSYPAIDKTFLITLLSRNDNPHLSEVMTSFVRVTSHLRLQK